jgi:hypothetical protein
LTATLEVQTKFTAALTVTSTTTSKIGVVRWPET